MPKSVTTEGSTSAGGPKNSVVCQRPSMHRSRLSTRIFWPGPAFLFLILSVSPLLSAMQCDNGLVYDPCGPACSHSCPSVQPSPHSQCGALSCVEGCFCPAGTVRHGKTFYNYNRICANHSCTASNLITSVKHVPLVTVSNNTITDQQIMSWNITVVFSISPQFKSTLFFLVWGWTEIQHSSYLQSWWNFYSCSLFEDLQLSGEVVPIQTFWGNSKVYRRSLG